MNDKDSTYPEPDILEYEDPAGNVTWPLVALFVSTFFLRIGFAGSLILFDWLLVWGIESSLGHSAASDFGPIFLTSFASITFLIAEIGLTGYYGHRSDRTGAKPVILWATFGAAIILATYTPSSLILDAIGYNYTGLIIMVMYIAFIHFLHGIVASGKVSPTLGFINFHSNDSNRSLRMAYYDNAVLYGRAVGMPLGGLLWLWLAVDETGISKTEQASRIAKTFPFLSILLVIAALLILFGLKNTPQHEEVTEFSIKEDLSLAARVMLEGDRRPLLVPWLALAAVIGSVSLWGPSIAFRTEGGEERALSALVPVIVIIVALALPAPFWGKYADSTDRKRVLNIGIMGLPVLFLGAAVGYPFYKDNLSLSNLSLLFSITPGIMMISALVPVLMSYLGDTAEEGVHDDGKIMSGYHFIIAMGEIIGILIGGITIAVFALIQDLTGWFGSDNNALMLGFLLFELVLIILVIRGILKIPKRD